MTHDKNTLRQNLKQQRKTLSQPEQLFLAKQISDHVLQHEIFNNSQHIAAYLAFAGEVATENIIQTIWQQNKNCYLPVLNPTNDHTLVFLPYTSNTPLQQNRFTIIEPVFDENTIFPLEKIDLLLMPLVAFDKQGNRLGMGAGFYDRTLASLKNLKQRPFLLGLAYSFQEVNQLEPESWDIALDAIVTEKQFFLINNRD